MEQDINKRTARRYTVCRFWLLFIFIGTILNTITMLAPSRLSLPISSYTSWMMIWVCDQIAIETAAENVATYLAYGAVLALMSVIPYIFAFILSGKRLGWMKAGLALYVADAFILIMDFIGQTSIQYIVFYSIMLAVHILGIVSLSLGVYWGGKVIRPTYGRGVFGGFGGGYGYGHGDGAFSTIRTVCLFRDNNAAFYDIVFAYHINGRPAGELADGETKFLMVDGNYQRLVISADGCIPLEVVIPAGVQNTTYSIGAYITQSGEIGIVATKII